MRLIDRSQEDNSGIITKSRFSECITYELQSSNCFHLGFVISGEKQFVNNDQRSSCRAGELFFTPLGHLCIENIAPEPCGVFEQIAFSFSSVELSSILSSMAIDSPCYCGGAMSQHDPMIFTPSIITRGVLESVSRRYDQGGFINSPLSEKINLANLMVSIFENDDEGLKRLIAASIDLDQVNFQRIIYENVFSNRGLPELAEETGRSLTTFKKDFRVHFNNSPHSWFLQQRLAHAQNLLAITDDTIANIGSICTFTNTSHFIKLYRNHFGITPAVHREELRRRGNAAISDKGKIRVGRRL